MPCSLQAHTRGCEVIKAHINCAGYITSDIFCLREGLSERPVLDTWANWMLGMPICCTLSLMQQILQKKKSVSHREFAGVNVWTSCWSLCYFWPGAQFTFPKVTSDWGISLNVLSGRQENTPDIVIPSRQTCTLSFTCGQFRVQSIWFVV